MNTTNGYWQTPKQTLPIRLARFSAKLVRGVKSCGNYTVLFGNVACELLTLTSVQIRTSSLLVTQT